MKLSELHKIYFLGIGGIGMSALARYFKGSGIEVSGYDRAETKVSRALEAEGISVFYMEDVAHLHQADLVVYTPAIPEEHPEFQAAIASGIPMAKRSQVLGWISEKYRTLAVAGTHGKTTTSAMLAHLLWECEFRCTAFLGGIANDFQSNFVAGDSDLLVAEADEFDRSFLKLNPDLAIITSMDADHLDIYGSAQNMQEAFRAFTEKLSAEGILLVQHELQQMGWDRPVRSYGIEAGDFQATNLKVEGWKVSFDLKAERERIDDVVLHMPGHHNLSNMLGAIAAAKLMGAPLAGLKKAVASFSGIYRRYECHLDSPKLSYIDDYAHHPAEIEAVIAATRLVYPNRQLIVLFQPHLYSRTRDFAAEFAKALSGADCLLLLDIYPARELPIRGVDAAMILEQVSTVRKKRVRKKAIAEHLLTCVEAPAVVLSLGAGDIDKEVTRIKQGLEAWLHKNE